MVRTLISVSFVFILAMSAALAQGNSPPEPPGNPPENPGGGLTERVEALEAEMSIVQSQIAELQSGAGAAGGPTILQVIDASGQVVGECVGLNCSSIAIEVEGVIVKVSAGGPEGLRATEYQLRTVYFQSEDCTGPVWVARFPIPLEFAEDYRGTDPYDPDPALLVPDISQPTSFDGAAIQSWGDADGPLNDYSPPEDCRPISDWEPPYQPVIYPTQALLTLSELRALFPAPLQVRFK